MYGMWADHISLLCRQIKRTKRTPEDASLSFERQHPHYRAFHVKRPRSNGRCLGPLHRSQIVPQLFRPRYRQHQLRSSNVQSVTDRTNVPLPPYKAIRHREGERCPLWPQWERQNHLSEFPRVSRRSVGFRYNYPLFDTPARLLRSPFPSYPSPQFQCSSACLSIRPFLARSRCCRCRLRSTLARSARVRSLVVMALLARLGIHSTVFFAMGPVRSSFRPLAAPK